MKKLVRKTLTNSPITPARQRKLTDLASRTDAAIDFSDIPPLEESFWKNGVRNPFYRPIEAAVDSAVGCGLMARVSHRHGG